MLFLKFFYRFNRDLRWRTNVKIVPVHCDSTNSFQITNKALEDAYKEASAMNIKISGLLITNPSNPLGMAVERSVLEEILDFIVQKNITLYRMRSTPVPSSPPPNSLASQRSLNLEIMKILREFTLFTASPKTWGFLALELEQYIHTMTRL